MTQNKNRKQRNHFPIALTHLMVDFKMSQEQLAGILGVTRQTISNYKSGITQPDLQTVVQIAEYFHVTTDYLLGRKDTEIKRFLEKYTDVQEVLSLDVAEL